MSPQLRRIVASIMHVAEDAVSEQSSPASLAAWDSLRHMKLILAIEEGFGVQFTDDEIVSMTDVRSIAAVLGRKRGADA